MSIPDSIIFIDTDSFWGTSITYLYIPASVKTLAGWCFSTMKKLKTIEFAPGINLTVRNDLLHDANNSVKIILPYNIYFENDKVFAYSYVEEIYVCGFDPHPNDNDHFFGIYSSSVTIYVRSGYKETTFFGKTVKSMINEDKVCNAYKRVQVITCRQVFYNNMMQYIYPIIILLI